MTQPYFETHEHQEGAHVRLQLTGELDMASAPVLRSLRRSSASSGWPIWRESPGSSFSGPSRDRRCVR